MRTVGILLAAGRSTRFGPQNKLLENFNGQPLCVHAAKALTDAGISKSIAVVREPSVAALLPEFELVRSSGSQSDSLKEGVRAAIALDADQIVICLADMPFVTAQLIENLMSLAKTHPTCACRRGNTMSPPAVISKTKFDDLLNLQGDRGAFSLFKDQPNSAFLDVDDHDLRDIDTLADVITHRENS